MTTLTQQETLNRYQILDTIGKDEVVTTYKAFDRKQNRSVVIKILANDKYSDLNLRTSVQRKLQQLGQLRHTYIQPILSASEVQGNLLWIQPYVDAKTLEQRLETETFTRSEAKFIRNRLNEALTFAHGQGIYHQNLKPSAVLFDEAGNLYLSDFGVLPIEQPSAEKDYHALSRIMQQIAEQTRRTAQFVRPHIPWRSEWLHSRRLRRGMIFSVLLICLLLGLRFFPLLGATVAAPLRSLIGNEAVARLQTIVFRTQDRATQWQHEVGLTEPVAPWEVMVPTPSLPPPVLLEVEQQPIAAESMIVEGEIVVEAAEMPPTPLPPSNWSQLTSSPPLGTLPNEGIWEPYLVADDGQILAKRTFLQPDSERPLTIVGIVAFDLTAVQLHYMLGTQEPMLGGAGEIPFGDRLPDKLLATFNGGFMSTHGRFGAMADGLVALDARSELATIVIDQTGEIYIGAWNRDIFPSDQWVAYRQNARLIITNSAINPDVYNNEIADWGGTIDNEIVTWRSALGLNADRDILYYAVGSGLTMPALADTFLALDAANAMLLDINSYWVHFAAIRSDEDGSLTAEALFPDTMNLHIDRYLKESERDFFYVTRR